MHKYTRFVKYPVIILQNKLKYQIKPKEPAVNPTAQKKVNSRRSLGRELTINFN